MKIKVKEANLTRAGAILLGRFFLDINEDLCIVAGYSSKLNKVKCFRLRDNYCLQFDLDTPVTPVTIEYIEVVKGVKK